MEKLRCNICEINIYVNDMNDKVQIGEEKIPLEVAAHIRKKEHIAREIDLQKAMNNQRYGALEGGPSALQLWMDVLT